MHAERYCFVVRLSRYLSGRALAAVGSGSLFFSQHLYHGAHPSPLILTTAAGSVCSVGARRSTTDADRQLCGSWGARRRRRPAPPSQTLWNHHPGTWAPASWSGPRALDGPGVCSVCACSDPTRCGVQHIPCRTGTLLSLGTRPYHLLNRPIPPICSRAGAHEPGAMLPLWIGLAVERPP